MTSEIPGSFQSRHIGPNRQQRQEMLRTIGVPSLDALIDQTIPPDIRLDAPLDAGSHAPARAQQLDAWHNLERGGGFRK